MGNGVGSPCLNLGETRTLEPSFSGVGGKGKAARVVTPGVGMAEQL